ncbi:MAG TPA: DUF72 domain-containing protein [Nevskiaceae bacterium]|nr:DUF72 domain-containing protein [Nevskiaceae bacterium]
MSRIRIGISGWRYAPWRGIFYPKDLPQRRELAFAAERFASIELNGSFYSLQRPSSYAAWRDETPDDFVFAVKGSRFITHILRLKGIEQAFANFLASGVFNLGAKLGPFLWQFPPQMIWRPEIFEAFLALLPRDTDAAQALARRRDARLKGRAVLKAKFPQTLRHAVEIRHPSFACPEFVAQLRRHGVAFVFADTAGRWPYFEDLTADFVYLRLHGDVELYTSGYDDDALAGWARRIRAWSRGGQPRDAKVLTRHKAGRIARDVYCYFDNDVKVRAPYDARNLARMLGTADGLPPLPAFRQPKGGWGAGLGPRAVARQFAPVFRRAGSVKEPAPPRPRK